MTAMGDLLLSFYGDDFTGSTDVMEALASSGISTVLFLGIPSSEILDRFGDFRAMGIAGTSRSETPSWMQLNLGQAFEWLKSRGAGICHYKVCSTFDSSPDVGSIGKAIEIGCSTFTQATVPIVVGAPQLKRYTAFGNLFAAYQGETYRIDRHPVMSRHPVTPMDEADLTRHLAKQTDIPVVLADLATVAATDADSRIDRLIDRPQSILMIDVDSAESQLRAGRQLIRLAKVAGPFVVGSSGVEYALLGALRERKVVGDEATFPEPGAVDRLAVVSGSVSPTTERQIRHAVANGFGTIALDPLSLVDDDSEQSIEAAVAAALETLKAGRSVILYTALGPAADRGADIDRVAGARHKLGAALGTILRRLVAAEGLTRAVIAGGDTSSHALKQLRVEALTTLLPLLQTPGSPLCLAHGNYEPTNGLQIALKGGQIGSDDYFSQIRDGRRA
ncbi:four-carbon acid sugar kinase family protein [Rhizobium grahamii]|uniref:four-carbon acid sugar kinase family protein n=1 Tax=Rhizobium grahamii TaxID=1120045 RepID=UPI00030A4ED2